MSKVYCVELLKKGQLNFKNKDNSKLWSKANVLEEFVSPWDKHSISKIVFRALWDSKNLYFRFKVYDPDLYIDTTDNSKSSINNSDRVELFFRSDKNMNPYYCLEIDPTPRIMDFKAGPNKQFDFNFSWPLGDLEVLSSIEKTHFIVEGAISIKSLVAFGLLKNGQIEAGIFRAKYNKRKDGNYEPTWVTWINPMTETPNFHIASSFGILKFENYPY
ncbi:hypothetical protein GCM10023314_30170 [Algibacter agarivorans]|uniref:Carbohydrate-binding domain-containing protein n=1 Tax=Algibacter agarivorans TaxID=1109741 RepID=A0ABP9GVC8_9FLAO